MIPLKGIIFLYRLMFLLQQLFQLVCAQLSNYQGSPSEWPGWWADPTPEQQSITNPNELQAHLERFNEELQDLTLDRQFIAGQLRILIDWLQLIKDWRYPDHSPRDPEYWVLYRKIQRLNAIHTEITTRLGDLNEEVRDFLQADEADRLRDKVNVVQQVVWWVWFNQQRWLEGLNAEERDQFNNQVETFQALEPQIFQRIQSLQESEPIPDGIAEHEETYYSLLTEYRRITNPNTTVSWDSPDEQAQPFNYTERLAILERLVAQMQGLDTTLNNIEFTQEPLETTEQRHEYLRWLFDTLPEDAREWLTWDTIESLSAWDIYALRERWVDLSTIFLIWYDGVPCPWKDSMETWNRFRVNYGQSEAADRLIGAWDILPIDKIYSIKVNWVEWVRWFSPRPWYFTPWGRYLAIHDGYSIEIWEMREVSDEERATMETAQRERLLQYRWQDISTILEGLEWDDPELPFTHESDIAILNEIIQNSWIEGIRYNEETRKIEKPEWMTFPDVREAINGFQASTWAIYTFVLENQSAVRALPNWWESIQLNIEWFSPLVIKQAMSRLIWDNSSYRFDTTTQTLISQWNARIQDIVGGGTLEYTWNRRNHLRYMNELRNAASQTWVPLWAIITLIYKENSGWDPGITARWSSAYWLWQMINGTWRTYGRWLNRNNPWDQLLATARYMRAIRDRQNCSWEHVLAYYNTWEGIRRISQRQAQNYLSLNTPIRNKIPRNLHAGITPENYFIWAVAYYNDLTFEQARATLWRRG